MNQTTTYGYDANGNLASTQTPNGLTTTYSYDARDRLIAQQTQDSTNTELTRYDYTLDATGRRTQVADHRGTTTTYTYDALYRLLQEDTAGHPTLGAYTHSYSYDAVGNRTRHTKDGITTNYTYDANGNRITKDDGTTQTTYSYDSRNRLIQAVTTSGGMTTKTLSYAYDNEGNRIEKTEDGITTKYLVDRNQQYAQVLKALDSSNATITDYLYGLDLIKQSRSATDHYYLTDGLGSTKALTDSLGNITDTYDYSAYGELIDQSGATPNDYLFTGEQYDPALDQYYLRARYYDPATGRFTSMDPFQGLETEPVTLHKYAYGNFDPVNHTDPSGMFSLSSVAVAQGINVVLTSISIVSTGISVLDFVTDPDAELTSRQVGTWVLMGMAGPVAGKALVALTKKCRRSKCLIPYVPESLIQAALLGRADSKGVRVVEGGKDYAKVIFDRITSGGTIDKTTNYPGILVRLQSGGTVGFRTLSTKSGPNVVATIDINVPNFTLVKKIKFIQK